MSEETKSTGKNTGMAVVAYILFFVPLLTEAKDDSFVKFHVKQGLVLFLAAVAVQILAIIPVLGWLIYPFAVIAVIIFMVMGILHAVNGEEKELPIIGKYASNFKF